MDKVDEPKVRSASTEPGTETKEPASPPTQKTRLRQWKEKLHWRAFWLLPQFVPHPYPTDSAYWRDRDQKNNEQTRVPEDQELRVGMVWGVELYGPAEIENLYAGLKMLGWRSVGERSSIQSWIQHQRAFGYGGWLNVGYVLDRTDRDRNFMIHNYSKLPSSVSTLVVRCHQISPSLTGILIGFQLNESTARCYEDELSRDRATILKRGARFTVSHWDPEHQKHESVDEARSRLRRMAGAWFKQNLPGFFCSLQRPEAFPTMELLMVKNGPIFHDPEKLPEDAFFGWRRLTANPMPWDVWSCEDVPGLQLTMSRSRDDADGVHIKVALDESKLIEDEMKSWGGKTIRAIAHKIHEELEGLLIHASTIQYLREQSRDIKLTRVALKKARSGMRSVMRTLQEIGLYFDRTLGSPAITRELVKKSEGAGWYSRDFLKFMMPSRGKNSEPLDLSEEIRSSVNHLASRVNEDESAMRAHIEQISSVLSVRESVKAQRRMEWLTVIAVVVAIVALIVGLPNIGKLVQKLEADRQTTASAPSDR